MADARKAFDLGTALLLTLQCIAKARGRPLIGRDPRVVTSLRQLAAEAAHADPAFVTFMRAALAPRGPRCKSCMGLTVGAG